MWYKKSSVENTVNNLANEIIVNRIRKAFMNLKYRFPTNFELNQVMKRVQYKIRNYHNSIYYMRKENMERKISTLVDQILDELKIV